MLKFKIEEFLHKNYILSIDFGNTKIITGSFLNEDAIITEYYRNKKNSNDEMDIEKTNFSNISQSEHSDNSESDKNSLIDFLNKDDERIFKILNDTDVIIISNLSELLLLPYYFKKLKIEISRFKIISTEPITQIGKYYLTP